MAPPFGPRQGTQVVAVDREQVVDAHERRGFGEHLFRHRLAPQPLLQRVKACRLAALRIAADAQFALAHRILIERRDQFGKRRADLLAPAAVDARLAAPMDDLDADTIPFPFGGIVGEIDGRVL